MKKQRAVIALSGGVDSSVTAALLQDQGYECIGIHIHFWTERTERSEVPSRNKCCTLGGLEDARRVCEVLNIPFYVMNAEQQFKGQVVDYFLESYAEGQTPNPCVSCNRNIKFGSLLERAKELQADFLASGHYARVMKNELTGRFELFMAVDKAKDQSYFLYHLGQEQLSRIVFPVGNFQSKKQIYELARKYELPRVGEKPESQGLCFFAEGSPRYFLQRYLDSKFFTAGPILTLDGREVGRHHGLPLYTIGQRHGLGIGGVKGEPEGTIWYVVKVDAEKNALIVGRESDTLSERFVCDDVQFVSGERPTAPLELLVRIRHRGALTPAVLEVLDDGRVRIRGREPFRAVAPGQSAVFYEGEKVVGGGTILKSQIPSTKFQITASAGSRIRGTNSNNQNFNGSKTF